MSEEVREKLLRGLNSRADPPVEATRKFVQNYCADEDSLESIRSRIRRMTAVNKRTLLAGLAGIEGLLANPPQEGVLARLVATDAGWVLDDPSDSGAREWLKGIGQMLREELAGG